jgi:iduronate 2-sulfatase
MLRYQGYSVRVDEWRYTAWMKFDGVNNSGLWDEPLVGEELYSHANDAGTDFDAFENVNVVEQNADVRQELMALLRKRFHAPTSGS